MDKVKLTRRTVKMDDFSQLPLNPHPVFPQWSTWDVYPHQYYGSMRKYVIEREYLMPSLENDFLRVEVNADIGGRVWRVHDKVADRDMCNFNSEVHTYNAGFGLNYTSGGIECNYPLAHSPTTSRQRELSTAEHEDGSASIIISEYERIWRTRWSVTYTLFPGRSCLQMRVRIYNRGRHDSRYMYWGNCGFVLNDDTQYLFPDYGAAMHGEEHRIFSWPMWQHRDLSYYREVPPEMLGLYMLDTRDPWFGYWDHGAGFGLAHYADLTDLPGRKHWTWGTHPDQAAIRAKTHHSSGRVFGEIQSGRIVIQEHKDLMPPETEHEWTEMWFPVRETGAFNSAGPGGAMRADVLEAAPEGSKLRVSAMGNGFFPNSLLTVTSDGAKPVTKPLPLQPTSATEVALTVKGLASPERHTTLTVSNPDGEVLIRHRLRPPSTRDCWREVVDRKLKVAVTAEELFRVAQEKARDWGNHDLRPLLDASLKVDEGFSPARRELGKWATWQGLHEEACEHFRRALDRDPDAFETRYHNGVALMLAGSIEEARKQFQLGSRADSEARCLVRLGELSMREGDFHHALKYLDRVTAMAPCLTRPRVMRAACLRRIGDAAAARTEVAAAADIEAQDPFLQMESMFVSAGSTRVDDLPARGIKQLTEQVRAFEPPLLEAAFDYIACGLYEEAEATLGVIPAPGPLALYTLAWVLQQLGRRAQAQRMLGRAAKADVVGHNPWRLEMIPILEWAAQAAPDEPRAIFLLGNLMMARRRSDDAVALWRKALSMGESHSQLAANLGFYEKWKGLDLQARLGMFQKAAEADPSDLYVKRELAAAIQAARGPQAVIVYLEREMDAVLSSPPLAYSLLNAYLSLNKYDEFDALCEKVDFSANWQLAGPHSLWLQRHFKQALQMMAGGELEQALEILLNLTPAPGNLGVAQLDTEDDRRFHHIGWIYEKLGDVDKAREYWEQCVAIPHFTGYESAYWNRQWSERYFQALSLQKLGRESEANALFDAMELLSRVPELPLAARQQIIKTVERGRFAPDGQKDPAGEDVVEVQTKAEA